MWLKFAVCISFLCFRYEISASATDEPITSCGKTGRFEVYVLYETKSYVAEVNNCLRDPDVTRVDLKSKIYSLEAGTFINMTKLRILALQNEHLENLKPGFIVNCSNLEEIYASFNVIRTLRPRVFEGLNLKYLGLRSNRIRTISDGAFADMNASRLDLVNNDLGKINEGWFENSFVENLDLSYNKIISLNKNVFNGINNLTSVNLNYNQISSIESGTFSEQPQLAELHLAGNELKNVDFVNALTLSLLDVGFNQVSYMTIDNSTEIDEILIYPNPWYCECLLKFWRHAWTSNIQYGDSKTTKIPLEALHKPLCFTIQDECKNVYRTGLSGRYLAFVNYQQLGSYVFDKYGSLE